MRIITEPTVRLVGRQVIDDEALAAFLKDEDAEGWETDTEVGSEKLIETAGRLCYSSYAKPRPGGNASYLKHIKEVGHGSVLEHAVYSLIITGVSRSLTHELVRHRVGVSPSQRSQRYCDEKDAAFVVPPALVGCLDTEAGMIWQSACEWSANRYRLLAKLMEGKAEIAALEPTARRKAAREAARSVLPNATATEIFLTINGRAARHFLELRGSEHADAEMRRLAVAVAMVLAKESPNLFGDFVITPTNDGGATISTPHPKV